MKKLPVHAKKVFEGEIFDVYQWEQEMYDGSTHTFERVVRPDTVLVIPVTEDGKIIICEQEQPHREEPYLSLISGRVEKDERPEEAARRELLEETGFESSQLELWDKHHISDKIDWTIYTYIAKSCKKVTEQKLDPGERIELKFVDFEEFIELLISRELPDIHLTIKALEAKFNFNKMEELKNILAI